MDRQCQRGRVKAIFQESALQFEVAADITLGNLCELLARWGQGHGEAVLVEVAWLTQASDGIDSAPLLDDRPITLLQFSRRRDTGEEDPLWYEVKQNEDSQ